MNKALLLTIVIFCACNSPKNDSVESKLDEFLSGQVKYFRFNGNVLVAENGKTVFQKSYGYADYDNKRLLNDSSVFELASVSKQFTATGILLLKEKGKLNFTDSLRQYFPELPYSNITMYHMLTHTSGLPDYEEAMNNKWDRTKIAFNNDMIAFLAKEKLPVLFAPGTKWTYSNTAYAILASVIEKVSGQTFQDYMAENVFQPLGMTHTRIYNTRRSSKDTIPNYAFGFVYNDSLKKYILPDSLPDFSFVIYLDGIQGDGVVNSTTSDLLKWDRAVKNHTLLSEPLQKEMLYKQALVDTVNKSYYGFGVAISKNDLGNIISHSGGWPGYTTFLARNIDRDQTFVVLSNNNSPSPPIGNALQHIIAGKPIIMPYEHKEILLDSAMINQYAGKYKGTTEIKLEQKGTQLYRVFPNGQSQALKPESNTKFFSADGADRQIEFETDNNKKVTRAWVIAYGVKTEMKKMQ